MSGAFAVQSTLMMVATFVVFALQAFAFVDAVSRRPDAYVAADKLTKPAWLIILGIALAAHMLIWNPISFLNLIGTVAALVYLLDARPAMRSLTRGR
jgi:asparagine N-glycosylation enzyme membrane subunit Stt3